jgi:hypothetical protein
MIDKRGVTKADPAGKVIIGLFVVAGLIFLFSGSGSDSNILKEASVEDNQKIGDLIEKPGLNFISYIIGNIPQFLVEYTNNISAAIIVVSLFLILMFTFSDILSLFGAFSTTVAWIIGIALAVIAANLKVLMYIAVWGFGIAAGLGVLSVVVGIGLPFLVFILIHVIFFKKLKKWAERQTGHKEFTKGMSDLEKGVEGAKKFGKAVRKDESQEYY